MDYLIGLDIGTSSVKGVLMTSIEKTGDDDITPMGSECDFADKRLVVKIGKMHKSVYVDGRKYHVDIITDQGVIYSQPLNLTSNTDENAVIALDTNEEYKFYRVEVVDENGVRRIAYGNPIWNTNK